MLEHASIGVRDIAGARRFYDAALAPLGMRCLNAAESMLGYGRTAPCFWIGKVGRPVPAYPDSGLHLCFVAPTRAAVDAFHAAALAAGGRDNGGPGLRTEYAPDYYAAFVIGPEGYRIEALHDGAAASRIAAEALLAPAPAVGREEALGLYAWLVGSWTLDVRHVLADGSIRRRAGEWHFGWALAGRAIQDVWIVPAREEEQADPFSYGTTLRVPDATGEAWHIHWSDPVTQTHHTMTGRREGRDIVQHGTDPDGTRRRWSFRSIAPDSFLWQGEVWRNGGWFRHTEFDARRIGA